MFAPLPADHPLRRLFAGLVEQAMYVDVGMCRPELVNYLTELLVNFVHVDRIYALRTAGGQRIEEVAEMISEAELGPDARAITRRRIVHKHVGDFTLFWIGVFPEGLRRLGSAGRRDHLIDYRLQGKRSYAIASDLTEPQDEPPAVVLRQLSEHFENCAHGLGLVRRGLDELNPKGFRAVREGWSE